MSDKTTAFYRGNTEVPVDFSAQGISSDGAVVLLDKLERYLESLTATGM